MANTPEMDQSYESLSKEHDQKLDGIIKEINDLSDTNSENDKVESEIIVNNELNDWLKSYLENHKDEAVLLINKINSIKTENLSDEVKQSLQNLVKLLSWVVDWSPEWNETEVSNPSFDKFKKMIEEWKLNKLNTIKDKEVQDVVNFVNDSSNDIVSLNLFADMVKQEVAHGGDSNFRHTDRENFHKVSDAIRSHFNMPEWAWVDTAKNIQLDKIFDGKAWTDLSELYKNYIWENWDWNELPENWNFKDGVDLIVSYSDFAKKFNALIPTPEETTPEEETIPEGEWNWGFDKVDLKEGFDIDTINKYLKSKWCEDIFRKGENWFECNMDNVKNFLGKIWNEITFDRNFISVGSDSRKTWLSSVQILLNKEHNWNLTVDGQYVKNWETSGAVKKFQSEYNESKKVDGKYPEGFEPLVEDWIPGPKTLAKLLENPDNTTPNPDNTTPNPDNATPNPDISDDVRSFAAGKFNNGIDPTENNGWVVDEPTDETVTPEVVADPLQPWERPWDVTPVSADQQDNSWMEFAQQTGYLPTENNGWVVDKPTDNANNESRQEFADATMFWNWNTITDTIEKDQPDSTDVADTSSNSNTEVTDVEG